MSISTERVRHWQDRLGLGPDKLRECLQVPRVELARARLAALIAEAKRAYKREAFELHPDRGGDADALVELNEAWGVLRQLKVQAQRKPRPVPVVRVYSYSNGSATTSTTSTGWTGAGSWYRWG